MLGNPSLFNPFPQTVAPRDLLSDTLLQQGLRMPYRYLPRSGFLLITVSWIMGQFVTIADMKAVTVKSY